MGTVEAINNIIRLVGGADNINKVWHCMTRLRFDVIDEGKIDQPEIKKLPGILGTQIQSDQFQIVIGPQVNSWYEQLSTALGSSSAQGTAREQKKNVKARSPCLWIRCPACSGQSCLLLLARE